MNLIGIWRLVETKAVDQHGNPTYPPYGPHPLGTLAFDDSGRMIAALCDTRDEGAAADSPREYNSYGGKYTFDGATLVTRVDIASDPARIGSDQVRKVTFKGQRMSLFPPHRAWRDVTQVRELIWEKVY